ncbi:MAG TPA: hypothetical protein DCE42_05335 [Myxococcales bacterium]|nr:hypothetical protein [Myxococcales bacterium]
MCSMTKKKQPNNDHSSQAGHLYGEPPIRLEAPTPLTDMQEEVIISRVEKQLLDAIASPQPSRTPKTLSRSPKLWAFAGTFAAACAALVFWMTPAHQANIAPMSSQHIQTAPPSSHASKQLQQTAFSVTGERAGVLKVDKQWTLQAQKGTQLALVRPAAKQVDVQLNKGRIDVNVVPNTMKRVSIKCAGVQVLVKGTIFSVHRGPETPDGPKWVRVEVARGKVTASYKKIHTITRGQGIRFALHQKNAIQRYTLPTPTHPNHFAWEKTFKKNKDPLGLAQYILDQLDLLRHAGDKQTRSFEEVFELKDTIFLLRQYAPKQQQARLLDLLLKIHRNTLQYGPKRMRVFALNETFELCGKLSKQEAASCVQQSVAWFKTHTISRLRNQTLKGLKRLCKLAKDPAHCLSKLPQ